MLGRLAWWSTVHRASQTGTSLRTHRCRDMSCFSAWQRAAEVPRGSRWQRCRHLAGSQTAAVTGPRFSRPQIHTFGDRWAAMKPQSLRFGTQAALCVDAVPRRDHGSRTSGQGVSGSSRGLLLASGAAGLVAIAASGTRARRRESACDAAPLPLAGETVDTDTDHLVKPSCGGPASLQERPWPGIGWVALRLCRHMIVFVPLALLYLPSRVAGAGARDLWWRALLFALESSGPALVKLGQWAATRSDIFPVELCRRLSQLHSGARTHLLALSAPGLQELLDDANYTLVSIDDEPIGSGCIAQVHRAAVAHNSSPDVLDVAIKLIHPGVVTGALADIEVMRFVARVLELVPAVRYLSLRESVEEFAGLLQVQLDLRHEAANLERFARNFHDNTHVSFPRPIRPLVSSSVLCETLQEGTPLSEWISGIPCAHPDACIHPALQCP